MALLKFGPMIADARGSVGGTVFSRNSSGNYARNRTKPVFPGSAKQVAQNAILSGVVAAWQNDLTTAQRDAWNDIATRTVLTNKLGEPFTPSGFNLYVRSNVMLELTGQTAVTAPPLNPVIPAPNLTLAWTTLVGVEVTDINGWDNSGTGFVLESASPPLKQTRNFWKGPFPVQVIQNNTAYDALPLVIKASGVLTPNTRLHIQHVAVLADGGVSHRAIFDVDIGTPA